MSERKTKLRRKLLPRFKALVERATGETEYERVKTQPQINGLLGAIRGVSQHRQRQRAVRSAAR